MSNVYRGEVWLVSLDPTLGREQAGTRPALVVSEDLFNQGHADLVIVVPITSRDKGIRSHVAIDEIEGGLTMRSFAKCENIRSISKQRLRKQLGMVTEHTIDLVEEKLRMLLGL